MPKIKLVDTSKEKPISFNDIKKSKIAETQLFQQKEIVVNSDKSSVLYTIFYIESLSEKYLLTYEEILIMLYLYELGLFKVKVLVIKENINVSNFIKLGYIIPDFTNKKIQLYKLSDKGISVVNDYFNLSKNKNTYLSFNRQTSVDIDSKVKSTLSNYLKS